MEKGLTYREFNKLTHCRHLGHNIYQDRNKGLWELKEVQMDNKIVILERTFLSLLEKI